MQNSWDKYNRLDTIYCKRNHFDLEQIDDEMKRRAEEMKWRKDHTMICAWCDREFVDYDKITFGIQILLSSYVFPHVVQL